MSDEVKRDELPWDQLGDHFPQVIDSLIFIDCRLEACDHAGDCPTHQVIVCGGEDCFQHPLIGEIASAPEWPCGPARETGLGQ